jgi:hypothetical protein
MRDSTIIYRSLFEAIKEMPIEEQAITWNAIYHFAFYGEELELDGIVKGYFSLIKPQLEANWRRYENGKTGGRPKKEKTKSEPKRNLAKTKEKPSQNQKETKEKANVNVDVNVSSNDDVDEKKPIYHLAEEYLNKKQVAHSLMEDLKIKSEDELRSVMKRFCLKLASEDCANKVPVDFLKHLKSWYRKTQENISPFAACLIPIEE